MVAMLCCWEGWSERDEEKVVVVVNENEKCRMRDLGLWGMRKASACIATSLLRLFCCMVTQ